MPRLQLFELEDFPWFPPTLRDYATDYLQFMDARLSLHEPMLPLLYALMKRTRQSAIIDLCSGSGGPAGAIGRKLQESGVAVTITLSDKFPNLAGFARLSAQSSGLIRYSSTPVDATEVPADLRGLRTMFNAFHHFPPARAKAILDNAVKAGQPIAIFEVSERTPFMLLAIMLTPLVVLAITPWVRPFSWARLFWTYLLPLVPLTCWWDGLVSQCRAYSLPEMDSLVASAGEFLWDRGRIPIPGSPGHLTYLTGEPRKARPVRYGDILGVAAQPTLSAVQNSAGA